MLAEPGRYDYLPLIDRPRFAGRTARASPSGSARTSNSTNSIRPADKGRPLWPRPVPDVLNYSLRDYGNRAGVWRVMEALEKFGVRASVSLNAAMCDHMPEIVDECLRLKWELFSHGIYNTRLISGMSEDEVRDVIRDSVETISRRSGRAGCRAGSRPPSARRKHFSTCCPSSGSPTRSTSFRTTSRFPSKCAAAD